MSNTDPDYPTWSRAVKHIEEAAYERYKEVLASGGEPYDEKHTAANEYAEGDEDRIYTWRARELFSDSSDVRECEDEFEFAGSESIDDRIGLCVYVALERAYVKAWDEIHEEEKA